MLYQHEVQSFYLKLGGLDHGLRDRKAFLDEERREVDEALEEVMANNYASEEARLHLAKELADEVFTCYGLAQRVGIDLDLAFQAVCKSNMTKQPTPEGKIQKGADYQPPDLRGVLFYGST